MPKDSELPWRIVAGQMGNAKPRRWLEPVREPMRVCDYIAAAVITVVAIGLFYFVWGATP